MVSFFLGIVSLLPCNRLSFIAHVAFSLIQAKYRIKHSGLSCNGRIKFFSGLSIISFLLYPVSLCQLHCMGSRVQPPTSGDVSPPPSSQGYPALQIMEGAARVPQHQGLRRRDKDRERGGGKKRGVKEFRRQEGWGKEGGGRTPRSVLQ